MTKTNLTKTNLDLSAGDLKRLAVPVVSTVNGKNESEAGGPFVAALTSQH